MDFKVLPIRNKCFCGLPMCCVDVDAEFVGAAFVIVLHRV